tara:strand:- start:12102 stop:12290 length:189 start_codon:yes stop_codon:yes gene_type:complete
MKYRQLRDELLLLSEEQLDTQILVFSKEVNTFRQLIASVKYTTMEEELRYGVDTGLPYICVE